jgi:hypothetical protein
VLKAYPLIFAVTRHEAQMRKAIRETFPVEIKKKDVFPLLSHVNIKV